MLLRTILLLLLFSATASAQQYSIRYIFTDSSQQAATLKLQTGFSRKADAINYVDNLPASLLAKGYLAASIDSALYDSTEARLWLYRGPQYRWGTVAIPEKYQAVIHHFNTEKPDKGRPIAGSQLDDWRQQLLDYLANNGYPFATVGMDSVTLTGDSLNGTIKVAEGPLYKIDSVHLHGKVKLKPNFIYPYLHMQKGMIYNQATLNKISQRLNELSFAQPGQPWELQMLGTGSLVDIYLQPRRSNVINALLGVMPATTSTGTNGKLLITGEADILLRNAFSAGETLGISWEQIQYKSPRLNLSYLQPYLFGSQAGIDFAFELFKKDSQFVNLNLQLGMPYEFSGTRSAKVYYQLLSTTVSYIDTAAVISSRQLPALANVSSNNLGVELSWNTTDYRFNPRKGMEILLTGSGGLKSIKKNNTVIQLKDPSAPDFNYESLYDTVKLRTYQLRIKASAAKYLPTGRLGVLKLAANAGLYQSQSYYRNELFQIGGYKLLRGFDEESIFAHAYGVGTAEFRYLSGRNSYFFAFADGGFASYKDQLQQYSHSYIGAGIGLSLETKNSVVNLSWAVGKRNDLPMNLRQSKIHLGFINYF